MKPIRSAAIAAILIAFSLAGAARAQEEDADQPRRPAGAALKAGVFIPTERDEGSGPGSAQFLGELEITFGEGALLRSAYFNRLRLSIGYSEEDEFRIIPITVSQVRENPASGSGIAAYFGYGLGLYLSRIDRPDTSRKQRELFGGFAVVGANFGRPGDGRGPGFVEMKYHIISRYEERNINGLQIAAGVRF